MSSIDEYKKQFEEGHISFEEALYYYGEDRYEEGREVGYDSGYDAARFYGDYEE